jgi:hypothetical protein
MSSRQAATGSENVNSKDLSKMFRKKFCGKVRAGAMQRGQSQNVKPQDLSTKIQGMQCRVIIS